MSVKLTGMYDVFRSLTAANIASFAQLRTEIEANNGTVSETIERCFVQKQKEFEEALKLRLHEITENATKQKGLLERIQGMTSDLNGAVTEALAKNHEKMEGISSAEKKVMQELQQNLLELQKLSAEKEESRVATAGVVQGLMERNAADVKAVNAEGHQLMANVVTEVEGVERMSQERTVTVSTSLVDVQKVLTVVQESVQRNKATFEGDIEKKSSEFEASADVVKETIAVELERQTKAIGETEKGVSGVLEMTQEFVGDFNAFAKNCTKTVKVFCTAELETYRPTGETPAKKNFNYPKQLSQTSPHGRILQRFRYDPNNSFNSSTDILPGLEDELPTEAKIDEEREEEDQAVIKGRALEDEEEFEDAKEEASPEKEDGDQQEGRFSENNENENPNTQKRRVLGSMNKAANRNLIGVQRQETIYVSSDDVSGKGKRKKSRDEGPGAKRSPLRSPLRTKSPMNCSRNSSGSSGRSSVQTKSPAWRN